MAENTNLPISFKPNAGMPQFINRKTIFPGTPEEFTEFANKKFAQIQEANAEAVSTAGMEALKNLLG